MTNLKSGEVKMAWTREVGPLTREQHSQSRRSTRSMRRQAIYRKLKFICSCCAGPDINAPWTKTPTAGGIKRNISHVEDCDKKYKKINDPKKHLTSAHKTSREHIRKHSKAPGTRGRQKRACCVRSSSGQASAAAACARIYQSSSFGEHFHLRPAFAKANTSVKRVHYHTCDCSTSQLTSKEPQQDGGHIYLKVRLCDIGPICVECKHKCSFVVSENVKSKLCFKDEMRACFQFEPGCSSQKKQLFHEITELRNNGHLDRSDSETNPSQLTIVNEEKQGAAKDTEALVSHGLKNQKSGELCSADERPGDLCKNGMQHTGTESSQKCLGRSESSGNKRAGIISEDSNIQNGHCLGSPFSDTVVSFHCKDSLKITQEKALKPNGCFLGKTDELDSFTCQRVKVYSGKNYTSCARTDLTWPFLKTKVNSTKVAKNGASNAGHSYFQINQPFEIGHPDPSQQLDISNPNQGVGACFCQSISHSMNGSSDLSTNCNCLLYSSQQTPSSSQTLAQMKIKESSSLIDSGTSTPSPSRLGITENYPNIFGATFTESSVSSCPSPLTSASCVNLTQTASFISLESNDSCDSSSLLPQYMEASQNRSVKALSPPKLEPFFKTSLFVAKLATLESNSLLSTEERTDTDLLLPPLLSPLNSPLKHTVASTFVEDENGNSNVPKTEILHGNHTPEMTPIHGDILAQDYSSPHMETCLSHDVHKCGVTAEEESQQSSVTDAEAQSPTSESSTKTKFFPNSSIKSSNNSSDPDSSDTDCSQVSEKPEVNDLEPELLDEIEAYEHDILLVDVFQEDDALFEKLPQKGLLKLGPVRTSDTPETDCKKIVKIMPPVCESSKVTQSIVPVNLNFLRDSPEDSPRRWWRPQCNSSALQCGSNKQKKIMGSSEVKLANVGQERIVHFPMENMSSHISPLLASRIGFATRTTSTPAAADIKWQKPAYCRNYFSEAVNCGFKACRFHHVPMDGDEKFCTETVARFSKNPSCLHKAGAVFTGFYKSNKPGVYFSMPVLVTLLWALLKAGMCSDLFSVLRTSLAHNIVPEHEFLLELFNFIREKCLVSFLPELMQLTFKMADAGLCLSLDCLDSVKNSDLHQTVSSNPVTSLAGNNRSTAPTEYLNLAHAMIEMELCIKQENWKRLGKVFQAIFPSTQQVHQRERISGHIAVALLSESKDRLTLPFAAFAEMAAHNVDDDSPIRNCIGRIGVSLMLRYHKTHQWVKGLKVVEVLSATKIKYATMKSLFGNEDATSRCHLINVATELFLLNNSVEGALNTLRENEWFLKSSGWPCDAADIENRTHVLLRLAEMTSHRDTLEILSNLPGLKEPNGHIDISRYTSFFTAHLQVCLDRQIVPLASDLVDFMLSKGLQVDHAMLQMLLHKLGKQNLWLRAREIFKLSVNKGYYPCVSAPPGLMTLMVPCQLGEIELALTFEMFITVNATAILALPDSTSSTMSITLKRTQSGESDYLSAGSRLLSAAGIPQPKLSVRYTAVNSSQEQVFALDISSARRWLRNNHLWANEVWIVSP